MLLIGVALLVLPGPGLVVIPMGVAILATEFHWAHRLKERFKHKFHQWREAHDRKKQERAEAKRFRIQQRRQDLRTDLP